MSVNSSKKLGRPKKWSKKPTKADDEAPEEESKLLPNERIAAQLLARLGHQQGKTRTGAIALAAEQAGVSKRTVIRWVEREEFLSEIEKQRSKIEAVCIESLIGLVNKKNPTAIIYLLKVVDRWRYDDQLWRDEAKREHELALEKRREEYLKEVSATMPVLVYHKAVKVADPDDGARPEGWDEHQEGAIGG